MEKINLLFLAAHPADREFIAHGREFNRIRKCIMATPEAQSFHLIKEDAVRPTDLVPLFREHKPQIVHFSGHGSFSQKIVLVDDSDQAKVVDSDAVVKLFAQFSEYVRLVVLNACYSREQAERIVQHIDCAIGMDRAIGDEAAVVFAQCFYSTLALGNSIAAAFEDAKISMDLDGNPTKVQPQLLTKSGVDTTKVFLLRKTRTRDLAPQLTGNAIASAVIGAEQQNDTSSFNSVESAAKERLDLIKELSALPSTQMSKLVLSLGPPAGIIPPHPAPVGDRATCLMEWAIGPSGCGLNHVRELLAAINPG